MHVKALKRAKFNSATFGTTRNIDKNTGKKMRAKMTKQSSLSGHDIFVDDDNVNGRAGREGKERQYDEAESSSARKCFEGLVFAGQSQLRSPACTTGQLG